MKTIAIALVAILAVFATPAEAKGGGNKRGNEQAKKKEAEKKREREEREARRDKIEAFMKDRDGNKDGSLTKDEFLTGESDKDAGGKKFDEYNKNKDRYLTKSEIEEMLGL